MNTRVSSIASEIAELKKILASIPDEALIERFGFEQRLERAQAEYLQLQAPGKAPESLRLTFRGAPILGSRGMTADFAGKASSSFADAFAAILAGINSTLRYKGPIPDRSKYPLMITGTAVGSFGFEMELPTDKDLFADYANADEAVELFRNLLMVSAEGTDDEIADIVQEIHPRAVRKVADFLDVLQTSDAWCGLEFRDRYFKYIDLEQLKSSKSRLTHENIDERDETYFGEFQGVLPQSRNFEFKNAVDGSIIRGKVDQQIDDPDILNRIWLYRAVTVKFSAVQVGQGRPRFTLISLDHIKV